MKRIAVIGSLVLAAAVSAAAQAAPPTPLPPQAAAAAASAPAVVELGRAIPVSPAWAEAFSRRPGAVTEGHVPSRSLAGRRMTESRCWFGAGKVTWGLWPYQQNVVQNTTWCAYYNESITYRSTYITLDDDLQTWCNAHDPYQFKTAGGAGYWFVDVQGGGYFDCQTSIPWITIYHNDWAIFEYTANGWYSYITAN
jgi:hypothetical protein